MHHFVMSRVCDCVGALGVRCSCVHFHFRTQCDEVHWLLQSDALREGNLLPQPHFARDSRSPLFSQIVQLLFAAQLTVFYFILQKLALVQKSLLSFLRI